MVRNHSAFGVYDGKNIPWAIDEIERDWLSGEHVQLPPEDVVHAFSAAERSRGRDWAFGTTSTPAGGRQWGFAPFLRVFAFGKRSRSLVREAQSQPRTDSKIILPVVRVIGKRGA